MNHYSEMRVMSIFFSSFFLVAAWKRICLYLYIKYIMRNMTDLNHGISWKKTVRSATISCARAFILYSAPHAVDHRLCAETRLPTYSGTPASLESVHYAQSSSESVQTWVFQFLAQMQYLGLRWGQLASCRMPTLLH
ncbi:hypothetical protein BDV25DRAFT_162626 [Aspergillus avenaceus]|uniref:Uncharacterized protein n=1 Tax=Aspergillus avenaceus TaxID=36643 RepID=A0A5N6TJ24_ASPAV|nr:hypothetical protein BDV25DRAFT_162626 [Aspergillus avenaceus]